MWAFPRDAMPSGAETGSWKLVPLPESMETVTLTAMKRVHFRPSKSKITNGGLTRGMVCYMYIFPQKYE